MNNTAKRDNVRMPLDGFFQLAGDGNQRILEQRHAKRTRCPGTAGKACRSLMPILAGESFSNTGLAASQNIDAKGAIAGATAMLTLFG